MTIYILSWSLRGPIKSGDAQQKAGQLQLYIYLFICAICYEFYSLKAKINPSPQIKEHPTRFKLQMENMEMV